MASGPNQEDILQEKELSLEYYTTQIHILSNDLVQLEEELRSYWCKANQIGTEIVELREELIKGRVMNGGD